MKHSHVAKPLGLHLLEDIAITSAQSAENVEYTDSISS